MTLYGEERKRKRARARGLIAIELLQGLEKLLVVQRHFAALSHLSSSSPCLSVIRKKSTILCYLLQQMLLFVGSGGTYDTSKEDEVKKACHSHLGQSVLDCQPPTSSNIENWQGRDNTCRWRHNARNMTSLCKTTCEKDVVGIVTFVPDWFTSHQSHYCLYYNGILRFLRKSSMLKVK